MLNRAAVLVRPKQAYIDWARSLDDSGIVPSADDERHVYLIPEFEFPEEVEQLLRQRYETIFEQELWGWHTNPSKWPKRRTYKVFLNWFEVEINSIIFDLCDYDLADDED